MKSMRDWYESSAKDFDSFFKPGDIVAQDVVEYFANILPPIIYGTHMMQAGGAIENINGRDTFITFIKKNKKWKYVGNCYVGNTENRTI